MAVFLCLIFCWSPVAAQKIHTPDLNLSQFDKPVAVQALAGDERVSSFYIEISDRVAAHFHRQHSEHVFVLSGSGLMLLGGESITIAAGDLVFIPANTIHSVEVTSEEPLRVISLQAPAFDGTDRVIVSEE